MAKPEMHAAPEVLDPLWYKSAIIYEVPVRAFFDSNADGIGDFRGLTQKLDYIQDLGVTALWLLPFYPSPLKDDGYDIADYYSINPIYGTLTDFRAFLREAKVRGLRVITELVVNHTSDQHPWFQRSRRAKPGSRERNFYVWSDTPEKYKEARIIFKDFEPSNWTWDPIAHAYYWHRFYSHQPDLNFDNPIVHREILRVMEFWLDLGVDGLRLDAVPYLYEREGTSCENLPETHQYLKKLRAHLDAKYGDRMLLAEANQWPEDAVTYFGSGKGDECHMAFHFPLMPRLFMAVRLEDRIPITDILDQTPQIPETSQWALFLRNHDELTLEMVTDEERDYMYRVYASESKARINLGIRHRLAPLLKNDRKRIELLNMLLLSLPGTPVIYYGDELGMGDNIFLGDRNGVRTPMHWSADKNAGFSRCTPQALYLPIILDPEYHYEAINVETQQNNQHSLLWWTRRVLALRKRWKVFGFGTLEFLHPENRKVLAFIRQHEGQTVLVVANLSRFPQPVELNLSQFDGRVPIELFGRTAFPTIGAAPYSLTLSPHSGLWFSIEPVKPEVDLSSRLCKTLTVEEDWEELILGREHDELEGCLPAFLQQRAWFSIKGEIKNVRIRELIPLTNHGGKHFLLDVVAEFAQFEPEEYILPIAFASGDEAQRLERESPGFVFSRVQIRRTGTNGVIYDATAGKDVGRMLFESIARRRVIRSEHGQGLLIASSWPGVRLPRELAAVPEPSAAKTEQRNTLINYGDQFVLKLFRRLESGQHPALESARFLAEKEFPNVPPFIGSLEIERADGEKTGVGILSGFIANAQRGWEFTQDALRRYFDRVRTLPGEARNERGVASLLEMAEKGASDSAVETIGTFFESARLLGQRVGELHLALASDPNNQDFMPEPFTPFYQRSLYQSFRNHLVYHFRILRREMKNVPETSRPLAEKVLGMQEAVLARYRPVHQIAMAAQRIRCHGNLHLGHVLHTGKDFIIIDFEGEPGWTLSQRRIKRSPLRDVAGMMRSFQYVAEVTLRQFAEAGNLHEEQFRALQPWARFWERRVAADFLGAYLAVTKKSDLLPKTKAGLAALLEAFMLDQAIIEMSRELHHRSEVIRVPLEGIIHLIETPGQPPAQASAVSP
jgi:maltose alpha-D-glucosyltransferase/alpha-amylase